MQMYCYHIYTIHIFTLFESENIKKSQLKLALVLPESRDHILIKIQCFYLIFVIDS